MSHDQGGRWTRGATRGGGIEHHPGRVKNDRPYSCFRKCRERREGVGRGEPEEGRGNAASHTAGGEGALMGWGLCAAELGRSNYD